MPPSSGLEQLEDDSWLSLPNALKLHVEGGGQVAVSLLEDLPNSETNNSNSNKSAPQLPKKRKTAPDDKVDPNKMGEIPESVLQYERQLRKVQADQRSVAALSLEKHLKIVYEDSDLIVADKPSGVLCVPGLYNKPNLLQLVCEHMARSNQKDNNDGEKTSSTTDDDVVVEAKSDMIVHRLDMDTSGLVVFSKTPAALKGLHAAFRDRTVVVKEYHALLCGHLPDEWEGGNIHLPLQRDHRHPPFMRIATPRSEVEAQRAVEDLQTHGFRKLVKKRPKPSHTEFRILQREYFEFSRDAESLSSPENPSASESSVTPSSTAAAPESNTTNNKDVNINTIRIPVTRVALTPHTGRTHQLRVHCAALGFPIVSDPAYGLYGEAQARGGLDIPASLSSLSSSSPAAEVGGAAFALQQSLNRCRPLQENTMCLHAAKLGIKHPISGEECLWIAPTPF